MGTDFFWSKNDFILPENFSWSKPFFQQKNDFFPTKRIARHYQLVRRNNRFEDQKFQFCWRRSVTIDFEPDAVLRTDISGLKNTFCCQKISCEGSSFFNGKIIFFRPKELPDIIKYSGEITGFQRPELSVWLHRSVAIVTDLCNQTDDSGLWNPVISPEYFIMSGNSFGRKKK